MAHGLSEQMVVAAGWQGPPRCGSCLLVKASVRIVQSANVLLHSFHSTAYKNCQRGLVRKGFLLKCRCLKGVESAKTVIARRIMPPMPSQSVGPPLSTSSMRVYAVSDLHTDYPENLEWLRRLSSSAYIQDTLIVAGDVAEKLETFVTTMTILRNRFQHVFFVPGNHDLWCRHDEYKHIDSLKKLESLLSTCDLLGVETKPRIVNGIGIIPIFSWYHQSFDKETDITGYRIPNLRMVCMDFHACRWQAGFNKMDDSLACFFDGMNLPYLMTVEEIKRKSKQIITFSHFLPRSTF
eukprot:c19277_g2_i4 orf=64-945(-)